MMVSVVVIAAVPGHTTAHGSSQFATRVVVAMAVVVAMPPAAAVGRAVRCGLIQIGVYHRWTPPTSREGSQLDGCGTG